MSNETDYTEAEEIKGNEMQSYSEDKAFTDVQISTAKKYPRNLARCIDEAVSIVSSDINIAKSCTFSKPQGGKTITGPSVTLAVIIEQCMGNMRTETRVIGFNDTHAISQAMCFDLQKNIAHRSTIKRSIVGKNGRYNEDMCVTTANAGAAVALRNCIFKVVPKHIIDKVYLAATEKIVGKLSDENALTTRRELMIKGLVSSYSSINLTEDEICRSIGRSAVKHINKDDILILVGFENSIKDGDKTPEDIFRSPLNVAADKPEREDKSEDRVLKLIESCKNVQALSKLKESCTSPLTSAAYDKKLLELK